MGFDIRALIEEHTGDGASLHAAHLNPQVPRMLHTIGFQRVLTAANGSWYEDADGERYLDFLSGFGVFGLGRNHPVIRQALHDVLDAELADMIQFDVPLLPGLLAQQLLARAPGMERVYFANSGTEAVEAALKFARCATGKQRVLYCDHAYHGLTVGSLSVNGAEEFRRGFDPLLADTLIPFGDLDAIEREVARGDVAALIVEPIQGKGVYLAPEGYLAGAQQLLHAKGGLLIVDEVQTGVGRTGRFFAHEYDGVTPDLVTVAKALSGGFVPVAATLARPGIFERVYSHIDRVFVHASTFAGNALAMTAALATLSVIDDEGLIANAERRGRQLTEGLERIGADHDLIKDIRGRGLMIGIEFGRPASLSARGVWTMLNTARKGLFAQLVVVPLHNRHRILTQVAGDNMAVIKLLPTLTIGDEEIATFLTAFEAVMADAKKPSALAIDFGKTLIQQSRKKSGT
ncbi:MAG TPA: aspartate aminotransferase family protein [Mycobacteriales bacterium]|nr:aspartate aminotransferase family protein [Mycobacteriales bacterium]